MEVTTDRIIGDCFEINTDIMNQYNESKLPKIIRKIRANYYKKKLLQEIEKIKDANVPLSKSILQEYFSCLYSNFPPSGNYMHVRDIKNIIIGNGVNMMEIQLYPVNLEDHNSHITVETFIKIDMNDPKNTMTVKLKYIMNNVINDYYFFRDSLELPNSYYEKMIQEINSTIIYDIYEYLKDTIENFYDGEE